MRVYLQHLIGLVAVLSAPSPCPAQDARFPAKVILLKDVELPVPFAVKDTIQPITAGTEVEVKAVDGEKVKIAFGLGEGFVQASDTDFLSRSNTIKQQPSAALPSPAPRFTPYETPVEFQRLTREEHEERQSKLAAKRQAEEEKRRAELEKREREEKERKEVEEQTKAEVEKRKQEAARKKAEQQRVAAQEQAIRAQLAALDVQIRSARQRMFGFQTALGKPEAGVTTGPNGLRDFSVRVAMQGELNNARAELANLQKIRDELSISLDSP